MFGFCHPYFCVYQKTTYYLLVDRLSFDESALFGVVYDQFFRVHCRRWLPIVGDTCPVCPEIIFHCDKISSCFPASEVLEYLRNGELA